MSIFYNQPSEFNFPIEFSVEKIPNKRISIPSTPKAMLDSIQYDRSYKARLDLAGYKKEELNISIHDHKFTVKATKPSEEKFEKLEKISSLPEHITENDIHTVYDNGLLTLRYPRHASESEPKRISIN